MPSAQSRGGREQLPAASHHQRLLVPKYKVPTAPDTVKLLQEPREETPRAKPSAENRSRKAEEVRLGAAEEAAGPPPGPAPRPFTAASGHRSALRKR